MTFEFDGVLGLGLASLAVDPEFSQGPSSSQKSWGAWCWVDTTSGSLRLLWANVQAVPSLRFQFCWDPNRSVAAFRNGLTEQTFGYFLSRSDKAWLGTPGAVVWLVQSLQSQLPC